jgi:hypothetical protein
MVDVGAPTSVLSPTPTTMAIYVFRRHLGDVAKYDKSRTVIKDSVGSEARTRFTRATLQSLPLFVPTTYSIAVRRDKVSKTTTSLPDAPPDGREHVRRTAPKKRFPIAYFVPRVLFASPVNSRMCSPVPARSTM